MSSARLEVSNATWATSVSTARPPAITVAITSCPGAASPATPAIRGIASVTATEPGDVVGGAGHEVFDFEFQNCERVPRATAPDRLRAQARLRARRRGFLDREPDVCEGHVLGQTRAGRE
ncbi:MAG: hypothetical protein F4Y01_06345, partial [Gammaproteobacteria bacterium]|nr:hypothetical protein [Gammaproteobacteria bacterium]